MTVKEITEELKARLEPLKKLTGEYRLNDTLLESVIDMAHNAGKRQAAIERIERLEKELENSQYGPTT